MTKYEMEEMRERGAESMDTNRLNKPERGAGSELACSEWMDSLAQKVERRAEEWDGVAVYRDHEIAENIASMLRDLAKDIRACGESASIVRVSHPGPSAGTVKHNEETERA